jgi:hypothetical protein
MKYSETSINQGTASESTLRSLPPRDVNSDILKAVQNPPQKRAGTMINTQYMMISNDEQIIMPSMNIPHMGVKVKYGDKVH